MDDECSEYEKIRQRNIANRQAQMKKHLEEMGILKSQIISGHLTHPTPAAKKPKLRKFFDFFQPIVTNIENSTEKYT